MSVKVRVRGIYSTAISKILHEEGYTLVDLSDALAERLRLSTNRGLPADVTVKTDNDDTSKILVIGHSDHAEAVAKTLIEHIPEAVTYVPSVGLYATLMVLVEGMRDGRCIVKTPYGPAEMVEYRECREGAIILASVIRVPVQPSERMVVVPGMRVVGDFAVVWRGSRVLFSPHLKNKARISELLSISSQYVRRGVSIKWRSNADEADLEAITAELPRLVEQLSVLEGSVSDVREVSAITKGEKIIVAHLTYDAKLRLDEVRRTVAPTADYHHMIRSSRSLYRDLAELLDEVSAYVERETLRRIVRRFAAKIIKEVGELVISHKTLNGESIKLGAATVVEVNHGDGFRLVLERRTRSSGVYDGLGVRKEVGDVIKTTVVEGVPYVVHQYFSSSGELKGIYANINTKPELLIPNTVEYVDLAIDLVRARGGPCELVDQGEFRSYAMNRSIIMGQGIYEYVVRALDSLLNEYCS